MRIIKLEPKDKFCEVKKNNITEKAQGCMDRTYQKMNRNATKPDFFFNNSIDQKDSISGVYQFYRHEGIAREISLHNYKEFYLIFKELIQSEWINKFNYFVLFEFNLYAFNEKKYIRFQIYFEYSNKSYIQKEKIKIINANERRSYFNIFSLVLSFIMIIMEFLALKKSVVVNKEKKKQDEQENCFVRILKLYNDKFKKPGMFEYLGNL
jgi:hypothetical protein